MAMKIGAKTQMMDLGKIYPNGMEVAPGIAKSTIWSNKAAFEDHSGIMVNKAGKRVISELDTNHNIKNEEVKQGGKLFHPDGSALLPCFPDQTFHYRHQQGDMDKWLAQDGKAIRSLLKLTAFLPSLRKPVLTAQNFSKTVARYNGFVKAGKDADFNRPAKFMKEVIADKDLTTSLNNSLVLLQRWAVWSLT